MMILGVQEEVLGMGEDLMLKDRSEKTKVRLEITRDEEMSVEVDVCEKHGTLVVTGGPCCFYRVWVSFITSRASRHAWPAAIDEI